MKQEMHKEFLGEYLVNHQFGRLRKRQEDNTEIIIIYRHATLTGLFSGGLYANDVHNSGPNTREL
jgi:hypothetical protein